MPVSGQELATLDFANLIGGPLKAIVDAQAKSAIATVNFIKEAAFVDEKDTTGKVVGSKARMVSFTYDRLSETEVDANKQPKHETYSLSVPFLTMLPMPYISVKRATIDFNAKITSTQSQEMKENFSTDTTIDSKAGWWFVTAKMNTKVSYQKTNANSNKEERTFDLHVHVEAQNEEMPAGTERLLSLLEQSIHETKKPVTTGGGGTDG